MSLEHRTASALETFLMPHKIIDLPWNDTARVTINQFMKLKLDRLADSFKNPHAKEDQTMEQKNQNSVAQCFVPPS